MVLYRIVLLPTVQTRNRLAAKLSGREQPKEYAMCTDHFPLHGEEPMLADPPKDLPQVIPAQMRRVNNLISRRVNYYSRENGVEDVTAMHGWILAYLYQYQDREIFQRDIERAFSITRSTVTNILQLMEKKGYIRRMSVPQDARLKRLVLTEAGAEAHRQILRSLHQTDESVNALLTAEESAELLRLLNKLRAGLE